MMNGNDNGHAGNYHGADALRGGVSRRRFLRGTGALLALPMLESTLPRSARAAEALMGDGNKPRRMLAVCNNLGLLPSRFFPSGEGGAGYEMSPYLKHLEGHRDDFTVFSGVSHPDVDGGHPADNCFLTAAPHPARAGFRNSISLDQYMAERVGHMTRFPSLTLGVNVQRGLRSLSWTSSGVLIPCEESPSRVFRAMFLNGSEAERAEQERKLALGRSILDTVSGQAKRLQGSVTRRDRERLDQYFTSVRELEQRMAMSQAWQDRPKPEVEAPVPLDPESPREYMEKVRLMYDVARLAFETDSTRLVTLMLDSVNSPALDLDDGTSTSDGYHNLSHHGKSDEKVAQLETIDTWHMKLLDELFTGLKGASEDGDSLMDRTMVLYGSNLGDADAHVTTNMPVLFAGGGFRHGKHLAFDTEYNYPLPNLFVSMLQRMGIETDRFASGRTTMSGLEMA